MDIYKEASRLKLRFQTGKGPLSVEQLWDLSLTELDTLAVAKEQEYKDSGKKSFLKAKSAKDRKLKLELDIFVDILTTKVEEDETRRKALADKEHNALILSKMEQKRNEAFDDMSLEELQKQLR
jgi:hypothetical protein